jgi:hypothetical protein
VFYARSDVTTRMLEAAGNEIRYFVIQLNLIVLRYWKKSEENNILPLFIIGALLPRRSQIDTRTSSTHVWYLQDSHFFANTPSP